MVFAIIHGDKKTQSLMNKHDTCYTQWEQSGIPVQGREQYLKECM